MADYIKTVIIAGVAGALTVFLCPDGEGGSGRYVKFLSSFVMLLVILAPLRNVSAFVGAVKSAAQSITSYGDTDSVYVGTSPVIELTAGNISDYIIYICEREYSLNGDEIKVRLVINEEDPENIEITEIQVYTKERDKAKRNSIKEQLEETLGCRVYVLGA